jgi:hypothetical protein
MFIYFKPEIIKEIRCARSRITVSFDGWGLKREKISVLSVVVHFINANYKNVTRLIGLPISSKPWEIRCWYTYSLLLLSLLSS